jgi:hypothetical protein
MGTLKFELSEEQETVLSQAAVTPCAGADEPLESSYRAWNSSFVSCDVPIESGETERSAS